MTLRKRTFLRYQLQNSLGTLPASVSLFEAALETDRETVDALLADFERTRQREIAQLRQKYATLIQQLAGKRVLFLGDSLTADELGYRPLVTSAAGLLARNGAISGATSASLFNLCRQRILSKTSPPPDILSIMLGTNDAVSFEREELHQVSLSEYTRNMREILTWAQKSGIRVLLFEIPPILEQRFCAHAKASGKLHSNRAINTYNAALSDLAKELGITPIPHRPSPAADLFEEDGLHWSVKGQAHFAEQWLKAAANIIL